MPWLQEPDDLQQPFAGPGGGVCVALTMVINFVAENLRRS